MLSGVRRSETSPLLLTGVHCALIATEGSVSFNVTETVAAAVLNPEDEPNDWRYLMADIPGKEVLLFLRASIYILRVFLGGCMGLLSRILKNSQF